MIRVNKNLQIGSGVKTIAVDETQEKPPVIQHIAVPIADRKPHHQLEFFAGLIESLDEFNVTYGAKTKFSLQVIPGAPQINFELENADSSKKHHVYYVIQARKIISTVTEANRALSPQLQDVENAYLQGVANNDYIASLLNRFGDKFVTQITYGHEISIVIEFSTKTAQQKSAVAAAIGGGIGQVVGNLDTNFTRNFTHTLNNTEYTLHTNVLGMPTLGLIGEDGRWKIYTKR